MNAGTLADAAAFDARMRLALAETVKPLAMCACGHAFEDHKARAPHRCGDCECASFVRPRGGLFFRRPTRTRVAIERVEKAARLASSSGATARARTPVRVTVRCGVVCRAGKGAGKTCGRVVRPGLRVCGNHDSNKGKGRS